MTSALHLLSFLCTVITTLPLTLCYAFTNNKLHWGRHRSSFCFGFLLSAEAYVLLSRVGFPLHHGILWLSFFLLLLPSSHLCCLKHIFQWFLEKRHMGYNTVEFLHVLKITADEWIRKLWLHIHNGILLSH